MKTTELHSLTDSASLQEVYKYFKLLRQRILERVDDIQNFVSCLFHLRL